MQFEMNIGLNVAGGDNSVARRTQRARTAIGQLRGAGIRVLGTARVAVPHEGLGEPQVEDTLVVSGDVDGRNAYSTLIGLSYLLSVELEQDCIGVYFPGVDRGHLVGPKAADWGDFNLEFFASYADVSIDLPANAA